MASLTANRRPSLARRLVLRPILGPVAALRRGLRALGVGAREARRADHADAIDRAALGRRLVELRRRLRRARQRIEADHNP